VSHRGYLQVNGIQPDHVRVIHGGQRGRLAAEQAGEPGVGQLCRRYLIATKVPEASCRAATTSPNPPEPSVRSPVNPGTFQLATPIGLAFRVSS